MPKRDKSTPPLPRIVRNGNCYQLVVDGRPLILLAGEMQNSSASDLRYLERHDCWKRLRACNCNAALVPVYWELVEPEEGRFDFALVEGLIQAARRHDLRLVLLWFGTWKNSTSSYVPRWVKTDLARFPRCQLAPGRNSRTISPLCQAACDADSRAFAELMRFIKRADGRQQTVVMMQVENEAGLLRADHDYSPMAEEAFHQPVPAELAAFLRDQAEQLHPALRQCLDRSRSRPRRGEGDWPSVFGKVAAEAFMAWHVASYVEKVVLAGKAAYGLPMFVNAWLDYGSKPGGFPSGGPVAKMLDIWRAAAPSIDAFAPDIYIPDFKTPCADFARPFNPFIVPECLPDKAAAYAFWVIGQMNGLCFSTFGIDHPHCWTGQPWQADGLAEVYCLLREMMPVIAAAQAEGRIRGVLQAADTEAPVRMSDYDVTVRYTHKLADGRAPAAGLIVQLDADEFVVVGQGFSVQFALDPAGGQVDFLWAEQGLFRNGKWITDRRVNGDDTWECTLRLLDGPALSLRRGEFYRYP